MNSMKELVRGVRYDRINHFVSNSDGFGKHMTEVVLRLLELSTVMLKVAVADNSAPVLNVRR